MDNNSNNGDNDIVGFIYIYNRYIYKVQPYLYRYIIAIFIGWNRHVIEVSWGSFAVFHPGIHRKVLPGLVNVATELDGKSPMKNMGKTFT